MLHGRVLGVRDMISFGGTDVRSLEKNFKAAVDEYLAFCEVEGESDETELLWQGRTALHAPEIDGKVLINDFGPHESLVPGTFYRAEITESHEYDVVARILE